MPTLCSRDNLVVESVRFPAGRYRLEGELAYPDSETPLAAAVLAGPHPLLGGNMQNNVVRALGDGLAQHGVVTLRFNYRGVGGSEGPPTNTVERLAWFWATYRAPDEDAHQTDLIGAVAHLRSIVGPELPVALVGYSFGCSLLSGAVPAAGVNAPLILIAPTVGTHNYDPFAAIENPKLVIAPEGDFAADAKRLTHWFERLQEPKELVCPRLDSHFFRGHEAWLLATVGTFLNGEWR
jgi:alpha/beta superfamily hydrolase